MRLFVVVVMAVAASLTGVGSVRADAVYSDSIGRQADCAPGTPADDPFIDIATVTVTNDPSAGTVTFVIRLAGSLDLAGNAFLSVALASGDASPSSNPRLAIRADDSGAALYTIDGSGHESPAAGSVVSSYEGGAMTVSVQAAEIGAGQAFQFLVNSVPSFVAGPGQSFCEDSAPNNAVSDHYWMYTMSKSPTASTPPPSVTSLSTGFSAAPKHGATFTVTQLVAHLSDGTQAKATALTCTAYLGRLKVKGSGVGGCTFALAKTAAKKYLAVTTTGEVDGVSMTRTDTFLVT